MMRPIVQMPTTKRRRIKIKRVPLITALALAIVLSASSFYSWQKLYPWGMFDTVNEMDIEWHVYMEEDWGTREGWSFSTDKPYQEIIDSLIAEAREAGALESELVYHVPDENGDIMRLDFDRGRWRLEVRVSDGIPADLFASNDERLPGTSVWIARDWENPEYDSE